jgi:uridylate kinase
MQRNASLYLCTGDDMGMGKTVVIAALLLAIFGKTGTELDLQVHLFVFMKKIDVLKQIMRVFSMYEVSI